MQIDHNNGPEKGVFRAGENGAEMGHLVYEWASDSVFVITHTFVDGAFRGRGVARSLVDAAVAYARENGYKIHPLCSYADKVLGGNDEFGDVYLPELPR